MPEPDPQVDETLLGPVVQVTLDADALLVRRLGDAASRVLQILQRLLEHRSQPFLALGGEHEAGDAVQELLLVGERGVVDE